MNTFRTIKIYLHGIYTLTIMFTILIFLWGCKTPMSALIKENDSMILHKSKYRKTEKIANLLAETTFNHRNQDYVWFWTYDGHFYNADGHKYFDSITVVNEYILYNIFAMPGYSIFRGGHQVIRGYEKIRGYVPKHNMIIPDYPMLAIFIYTPQIIWGSLYGVGLGLTYLYDYPLHDVPVLLTKGIMYPLVANSDKDTAIKDEDSTSDTLKSKRLIRG